LVFDKFLVSFSKLKKIHEITGNEDPVCRHVAMIV